MTYVLLWALNPAGQLTPPSSAYKGRFV
jgi:hypothetical protein